MRVCVCVCARERERERESEKLNRALHASLKLVDHLGLDSCD